MAQLSPAAEKIRAQVQDFPIGGKITVQMLDGREYYGHVHSIEAASFSIREVDLKQVLTLNYKDVKRDSEAGACIRQRTASLRLRFPAACSAS